MSAALPPEALTEARTEALTEADVEAVLACYRSGWLTMGPRTRALEADLARACGTAHAVTCSSGTAALHLACRAAGVGPGDEVVVPAFAPLAVGHAPRWCGGTTVLADSTSAADPTLSVADVARRLTDRTRAVVVVDPWGYAADLPGLRALADEHGLVLVELAAPGARDAAGAPCGTRADLACLSFPAQQVPVGEGGAVLTSAPHHAESVASLRSHAMTSGTWDRHRGHDDTYDVVDLGYNYRLDEPRAALIASRLPHLEVGIASRRRVARRYRRGLAGVAGLAFLGDDASVDRSAHLGFPLLVDDARRRPALREGLAARGVPTTHQPALHTLDTHRSDDPGLATAGDLADRHLVLPLHAGLGDDEVDATCAAVRAIAGASP